MTSLEADGVTIIEKVTSEAVIAQLRNHFDTRLGKPGARGFDLPNDVLALVSDGGVLGALANALSGSRMKAVRVLFFDKAPNSNWSVPWHQDRTIAVRARHELSGFGPWSVKNGVVHVEPPVALLEGMLTLRLFVDDCGPDNGPLAIARGSHHCGRLAASEVSRIAANSDIFVGTGRVTDVLAMKLLAVHSSKRSVFPGHRRVLHVDYSHADLPAPLEWAVAA